MTAIMLVWRAITAIHPGTGQDSSGIVDLAVAREGGTGIPIIPDSSIKGSLRGGRDLGDDAEDTDITKAFGTKKSIGDLAFGDALVFALPIPSLKGTFALVTCPYLLDRVHRERKLRGFGDLLPSDLNGVAPEPESATWCAGSKVANRDRVVLNDFSLTGGSQRFLNEVCQVLANHDDNQKDELANHLVLVPNEVFSHLCKFGLEVRAHIRLNPETMIVERGALWYAETLPAESLLVSFIDGTTINPTDFVKKDTLYQFGGKKTLMRGTVHFLSVTEAHNAH